MNDTAKEDAGKQFPFISLEKALGRARELYDAAGDHEAPIADAFEVWGYSLKSSGGHQTIGALKMYGILRDSGARETRKVALTDAGLRYFRDEREDVHVELRRHFALSPKLIRALWKMWGTTPPADNIARSHLKIDRELSDQSARSLLSIYKENLGFAELTGNARVDEDTGGGTPSPPPPPPKSETS